MLFGFFQASTDADDDIATGTYADGMIEVMRSDPSAGPRERSLAFRRRHERDYGAVRTAGQTGAGMVA
ncbi:hypothetical protein [Shinella sp.]|uniref:hypothetical protein n=1 Tax=Shinella sp. TaxID=1870904 RepID=UPI002896CD1C|nr:hypothetical protein [Shinella sp.]